MSRLSKFLAQPQEVEICGEKFMLKPFKVSDLPLINKMSSKDPLVQAAATKELVKKVAKELDSSITEEDMENLGVDFVNGLMEAVSKVNNIDLDEAKKKVVEQKVE